MADLTTAGLAQKVDNLADRQDALLDGLGDWASGSVGGGPNSDGRYPLTNGMTGVAEKTVLVHAPAVLANMVSGPAGQASASATAAAASATLADTSRVAAQAAQAAADASKTAAATSETNALAYRNAAQTAETAAETAQAAAEAAEDTAITKAGEASASATTATTKAGEASASATAANTSKNDAQSAKTSAETARDLALGYRDTASTHATNAGNAKTAAEAARDLTLGYRDTASGHANTATTKAGEAATSATNAATSETNANTARVAAEAARDAALGALDSFDDRYLGPKAVDPTLDNDGNALIAGAIYFNTGLSVMKLYTGSIWVAAYVQGTDFVAKIGDSMTGPLTLSGAPTQNLHAATKAYVDLLRTGANTFSGLQTYARGPATTAQDYMQLRPTDYGTGKPMLTFYKPATANRWDVTIWDGVNNNGTLNLSAQNLTWNDNLVLTVASNIADARLSSNVPLKNAANTFTASQIIDGTAANVQMQLRATAGFDRSLGFYSGASARWLVGVGNAAETGSNEGSDLAINAYTDAGAFLRTALFIDRSSGGIIETVGPAAAHSITGFSSVQSGWKFHLTPTDFTVGKPAFYIQKGATATVWDLGIGDGFDNSGILNISAGAIGLLGHANVAPGKMLTAQANDQYGSGIQVLASTHGTSERAGIILGDWTAGQDIGANGTKDFFIFSNGAGTAFRIGTAGAVTCATSISSPSVTETSDISLKSNITPLAPGGSLLLRPKIYDMGGRRRLGFIAQDVQPHFPELIGEGADDLLTLHYGNVTAINTADIQELYRRIELLEARLAA